MNEQEKRIIDLAREVRAIQKRYYAAPYEVRTATLLRDAKALEKALDDALAVYDAGVWQPGLLGEER